MIMRDIFPAVRMNVRNSTKWLVWPWTQVLMPVLSTNHISNSSLLGYAHYYLFVRFWRFFQCLFDLLQDDLVVSPWSKCLIDDSASRKQRDETRDEGSGYRSAYFWSQVFISLFQHMQWTLHLSLNSLSCLAEFGKASWQSHP